MAFDDWGPAESRRPSPPPRVDESGLCGKVLASQRREEREMRGSSQSSRQVGDKFYGDGSYGPGASASESFTFDLPSGEWLVVVNVVTSVVVSGGVLVAGGAATVVASTAETVGYVARNASPLPIGASTGSASASVTTFGTGTVTVAVGALAPTDAGGVTYEYAVTLAATRIA